MPPSGRFDLRQPFAGTLARAIVDVDEIRAARQGLVFQPRFTSWTIRGRPHKPLESWNRTGKERALA